MSADNHRSRYRAYLLRCWQDAAQEPWRFSLEDPHSGRRHGFATLDALVAAIERGLDAEELSTHTGTAWPAGGLEALPDNGEAQ